MSKDYKIGMYIIEQKTTEVEVFENVDHTVALKIYYRKEFFDQTDKKK